MVLPIEFPLDHLQPCLPLSLSPVSVSLSSPPPPAVTPATAIAFTNIPPPHACFLEHVTCLGMYVLEEGNVSIYIESRPDSIRNIHIHTQYLTPLNNHTHSLSIQHTHTRARTSGSSSSAQPSRQANGIPVKRCFTLDFALLKVENLRERQHSQRMNSHDYSLSLPLSLALSCSRVWGQ